MTVWSALNSRTRTLRVAERAVIGLSMLGLLFALRWRFDGNPFDFQAFRAADSLARQGFDPYDASTLNGELASNPTTYGNLWAEDSTGNFRMFFFNPPVWLVQVRGFGSSPLVMSIAGGMIMVLSMVWLTVRDQGAQVLGYAVGAFVFLTFGMADTTMWFGQTGLLLAGIVGAYLVLASTTAEGIPIAMLAFKPHLALALGLPGVTSKPVKTATRVAIPLLILGAATLVLYDPSLWTSWIRGLTSGERTVVYNDLTIRTLSPRFPLPDWTTWPLLITSFVFIAAFSRRFRQADIGVMACASLALTAFLSGHAFSHDFLWLVFVPILCRWRAVLTIAAAVAATAPSWSGHHRTLWNLIDISSAVMLAAVVYLVWAVRASHVRNERSTDRVASGKSSVHGENRTRREHRLAAG